MFVFIHITSSLLILLGINSCATHFSTNADVKVKANKKIFIKIYFVPSKTKTKTKTIAFNFQLNNLIVIIFSNVYQTTNGNLKS